MNRIFNTDVAAECGEVAAAILHHFYFWVEQNKAAGRNEHDGKFWTYHTADDLQKIFPYLSVRKVRYAIKKLAKAGFIVVDNFNKLNLDQTRWYSLTDKAFDLLTKAETVENMDVSPKLQNCNIQVTNLSVPSYKFVTPIPDVKPYVKPYIKKKQSKKKFAEFVTLTEDEYQLLVDKFGEQSANRMIEILDNYKGSKGKKYKSDYRAILSWVVRRYEEEQPRKNVVVDAAGQAKNIIGGGLGDRCNSGCYSRDDGSIRATAESV